MKFSIQLLTIFIYFISTGANGQILNQKQKNLIIDELSGAIKENYVLQDSVSHILLEISEAKKSNEFSDEFTLVQYASYLTRLLRSITQDGHFAVLSDSSLYKLAVAVQQNDSDATAMSFGGSDPLGDRKKNFFFSKLEVLGGNVGVMKIERIPSLESAKPTLDAAMTFLTNTDALIIDLRANPGGVGGFIPYLISYFMPEQNQLLYSREFLAMDSISYHYTHSTLGADQYLDKPVYLLIDRFTGSAATNMAYTMKTFEAAILIGENTGSGYRGAHSASIFPLYDELVAVVPIGRVVNALSNTNWRQNGVDPDIPCDPELALEMAYKTSLKHLLSQASDPGVKNELKLALETLEIQQEGQKNANNDANLSEYAGQYGETTITWENEKLFTQRPSVPIKLELKRKKADLFGIVLPPNARGNVPDLRFNRNDGNIISLTTIRDGKEERTEEKEK